MSDAPELAAAKSVAEDVTASVDMLTGSAPATPPEPPFVPLEGTPSALPDVQVARAEAEAARRALGDEIDALRGTAARTFDVKAQITAMPERIQRDPARAAKVAGGAVAGLAGIAGLRRLRRAKPPTLLPPEVEAAIGPLGKDAPAVRAALNKSFTKYLEAHGARGPVGRIPRSAYVMVVPVVSAIAREGVRQYVARTRKREG